MGKDWDKAVPSVEIWQECLRVLKDGAFIMVMSAPRQDVLSHMIVNLEKGGFDIGFTPLYHTYASGFPKAQNVHKNITKSKEKSQQEVQELWRTIIHTTQSTEQSNNGSSLSSLLEDLEQGTQCEITSESRPSKEVQVSKRQRESFVERWSDLSEKKRELRECKICSLPTGLYINGKKRWICYGTSSTDGKVSWTVIDENGMCTSYQSRLHGQQNRKPNVICEQCGTQALRTFNGAFSGFQPKPAVEVILVAMKPLSEKTYVDQALKNSKGITWLDSCRIPYESEDDKESATPQGKVTSGTDERIGAKPSVENQDRQEFERPELQGRFPANLLVSDDVLNDGKITKGTARTGRRGGSPCHEGGWSVEHQGTWHGDSGSYSRYFDLDKWANQLDFLKSKAYNKEICNNNTSAINATKSSKTGQPIEQEKDNSVQSPVLPSSDLKNQSPDVSSAKKSADSTGTSIAQKDVPINLDTETLTEIISISANELITLITPSKPIKKNQKSVKDVERKKTILNDTIQICQKLLKSYGSANPVIGEQKQLEQDIDQQLKKLPDAVRKTLPFIVCPKASKSEKNKGLEKLPKKHNPNTEDTPNPMRDERPDTRTANNHPTVKPLKLMSYLIQLGSRRGDIILDPFCGSGSTCIAAKQLGRKYIGIEREQEYVEIAEARLKAVSDSLL